MFKCFRCWQPFRCSSFSSRSRHSASRLTLRCAFRQSSSAGRRIRHWVATATSATSTTQRRCRRQSDATSRTWHSSTSTPSVTRGSPSRWSLDSWRVLGRASCYVHHTTSSIWQLRCLSTSTSYSLVSRLTGPVLPAIVFTWPFRSCSFTA